MATISEISDLDSGVASPETTPEGQDPLKKSSPSTSAESADRLGLSNSTSTEAKSTEKSNSTVKDDKLAMVPPAAIGNDSDGEEDDDENVDESIAERLWGLTEMFPSSLRSASRSLTQKSISFIKASYQFSRQVVWISVSSSLLLFAPVMFEIERYNVEEMVKQDRNRLVLGPGSAMSGAPSGPGLGSAPVR